MKDDLKKHKCPICKKGFFIRCKIEDYGWTYNKKPYCSYSCMRVKERKDTESRKNYVT